MLPRQNNNVNRIIINPNNKFPSPKTSSSNM